jgi:hypothetical protein
MNCASSNGPAPNVKPMKIRLCVATATDELEAGSRTGGRGTFLCLSKEKYPKETTPGCRFNPARHKFWQGLLEGASQPLQATRCILASPLTGKSRQNFRCSARHNGNKYSQNLIIIQQLYFC